MHRNFSKLTSISLSAAGLDLIRLELSLFRGLARFEVSGLSSQKANACRSRVLAAIRNSGFKEPQARLVASFTPVDTDKKATACDLALALCLLQASGQINFQSSYADKFLICGELSLSGKVEPVTGVYAGLSQAQDQGFTCAIVPQANLEEAKLCKQMSIFPVGHLMDAVDIVCQKYPLFSKFNSQLGGADILADTDRLSDYQLISGQDLAYRGLVLAAAGHHPLLILGSPGCGKSLLAHYIQDIMPSLSVEDLEELRRLYSVNGISDWKVTKLGHRPFVTSYANISQAGLIGGGREIKAGLCSRAHKGVLFLDEVTEYPANLLASLREPLTKGYVEISRLDIRKQLPADFLLIAAGNPCPCGYYFEGGNRCTCSPWQVRQKMGRLSGPLWDRFSMSLAMTSLETGDLLAGVNQDIGRVRAELNKVKNRIASCWTTQLDRNMKRWQLPVLNNSLPNYLLLEACDLEDRDLSFIQSIPAEKGLTARSFCSLLRLARTIADLDQRESVSKKDLLEAAYYRLNVRI